MLRVRAVSPASLSSLVIVCFLFLFSAGCGVPSFLITPVANSNTLEESEVQPGKGWSPGKIAIIEVEGLLMNARSGGFLQPTENKVSLFAQQMERAANDRAVKAVVLRINSPGGTVTASDIMYSLVQDFRTKTGKPVIASTQEVAASGGYYVALAADEIVAQPTTVIGSIGVIFTTMEFSGTMEKLGVTGTNIKSGPLKDMGSPLKPLGDQERDVMQAMVNDYYARFVGLLRERRPGITDSGTLTLVTDGRVFTGEKAVELGLADRAGRLEDALDLAREKANAPKAAAVLYTRPYGYGGSIYAETNVPRPHAAGGGGDANVLHLDLPGTATLRLPGGFYYVWEAGL
jgi:protease-4